MVRQSTFNAKAALRRALIVGPILAIAILTCFWFIYFWYPESVEVGGRSFNRGENGLWLRYLWYAGDAKYWSSVNEMVDHLNHDQIIFAYFHVRELKPDGRLALRNEVAATKLTRFVHTNAPTSKVIAWISLGNSYPARGTNLSEEAVRKTAVAEAVWLTKACGFDGIQWDYEPCRSGDEGLLALLRETRAALAPGKIISVATPTCVQDGEASTWYSWNDNYFVQVSKLSDQIAVMCYDLVLLFPWQYENAIRKQVQAITSAVSNSGSNCRVIFGIPAYRRNFIHDHCETLRLALRALRSGIDLRGVRAGAVSGVSLFADYTIDEKEWQQYRKYWLNK